MPAKSSFGSASPWEGLGVIAGMCLLGLGASLAASGTWVMGAGLIATAYFLIRSEPGWGALARACALIPWKKQAGLKSLMIGGLLGVSLGLLFRNYLHQSLLLDGLSYVALISPLIGVVEELLFRGFVQTRLQAWGAWIAVAGAALGHSLYKAALFVFSATPVDFSFLLPYTLGIGLIFALGRQLTGRIWFALVAHATFDIVVYGDHASMPWWVWM